VRIVKPPKQPMPKTSISHALAKHKEARRNLSDTLSETGQFELKEIKDAIAKAERDAK